MTRPTFLQRYRNLRRAAHGRIASFMLAWRNK
jgi:hypothetical protein